MADAPEHSSPSPGFLRRHAGRFAVSLVLLVCVVWGLEHSGLNLVPPAAAFAHVRWVIVPVYLLVVMTMTYFRAARWRYLLAGVAVKVPRAKILSVSLVGFAAIMLLPLRLGEFVRPAMMREKGKISFSAATGTIITERVVDGLFLSTVLAVSLLVVPTIQPLPVHVVDLPVTVRQVRYYAFVTLGGFSTAFVVIAVYFFARKWAHRITLAVVGVVSRPLAERLAGEAERLADGLAVLRNGRAAAGFLFETTLYWLLNALGMWLLAWGVGLQHANGSPVTFGEACAMMGMLGVTILIPGPPGLLGIFQAGMFCGMTMYFPAELVHGRGAVYACLVFSVQALFTIIAGGSALFSGHTTLKSLSHAEMEAGQSGGGADAGAAHDAKSVAVAEPS